jgi:hypothetical protein
MSDTSKLETLHANPESLSPIAGKQLRDWIIAQLMWADDGRLGMLRTAGAWFSV